MFVDNLATVPVLADLLTTAGYNVIKHTETNALPRFRAEKDLKRKEEGLFLDQARIEVAAEDEIDLIRGFDLYQIFVANFS